MTDKQRELVKLLEFYLGKFDGEDKSFRRAVNAVCNNKNIQPSELFEARAKSLTRKVGNHG